MVKSRTEYLNEIVNTLGLQDRVTHLPNELSGESNKEYQLEEH